MKKTAQVLLLCLILGLSSHPVSAAPLATSVTGPTTIRAGNTLTVSVMMNGTGLSAVQGQIQYDATQLTFQSSGSVLAGWAFDDINSATAGRVTFLISDTKLTAPISTNKRLFTLTFAVRSTVATGATVRVTATGFSASDGSNDFSPAPATYSVKVAAPASANNLLSTLSVTNAAITPAFNANTTAYSASVAFAVADLALTAKAADAKARVTIGSKALVAGAVTDVTVTVTAENGAQRVYTISVTRANDPNYVPGTVSTLSDLTVAGFLLSPPFNDTDKTYLVWLPYEVEGITVEAVPTDPRASFEAVGESVLAAGQDNVVTVVCTAEDGTTKTSYTLIVKRAAAHDAASLTPGAVSSPTPTQDPGAASPTAEPTDLPGFTYTEPPPVLYVAILILGAGLGFLAALIVGIRVKQKHPRDRRIELTRK